MIGPLPTRYRLIVLAVSLIACLGLALWLATGIDFPFEGYVLGVVAGLLVAFVLLHDFRRPVAEVPVDPI